MADNNCTEDEIDFDAMIAMANKREAAQKSMKPCPECESRQVQLIDWGARTVWRCRSCRHCWDQENG